MPPDLRAKQTVVFRLATAGVVASVAYVGVAYALFPPLAGMDGPIDRLVLALRCDAVAALTLAAGIQRIATDRRRSDAIDPLAGMESRQMQVHARYVQNTLEQLVLFVLGTSALSTYLDGGSARIIPVLTSAFVLARVAFWVGYLRDPLVRAFGMAATFMVTVPVLLYVVYRIVRGLVGA
ncbi:MAG: MAPEG family protein [Polyangiaceae bacterium]|nr:MAPEG family protein [Polyangiaceae bacterium]